MDRGPKKTGLLLENFRSTVNHIDVRNKIEEAEIILTAEQSHRIYTIFKTTIQNFKKKTFEDLLKVFILLSITIH